MTADYFAEKTATRRTVGVALLNVVAAGSSFATHLLLARSMGAAGYGRLAYSLAWVTLLSGLAMAGPDKMLVRYVAAYAVRAEWGLLGGLLRWANRVLWLGALLIAALVIGLSAVPTHATGAALRPMLPAMVALLCCLIMLRSRQAILRGLNAVILSQIAETLVQPGVLLVGVVALRACHRLTAPTALAAFAAAAGIAAVTATVWLRRRLPPEVQAAPIRHAGLTWSAAARPLLLVGALNIVGDQIDILLLGLWHGAHAVSVYSVARRAASLIAFALTATNQALAPTFARLHAQGEMVRLQRVVTRSARRVMLAATLIAAGVILCRGRFLGLFGVDFAPGQTALCILVAGQWFSAAFGSVATLLMLTGHERDAAQGIGVSVALNCLLDIVLIPCGGIIGAAVAGAIGTLCWNVMLAWRVRRRLGLATTAWRTV
jgi:O-antigen/teichoic acid export membrane protein